MAPLVCQEAEGERVEDHGQEEFRQKHEDESPEGGTECEDLYLHVN